MQEVIAYLDKVDPVAAARARDAVRLLRPHLGDDDGQAYGFAAAFGAGLSCERQAIDQLVEMQRNALDYARRDGLLAEDELFYAQQNAQHRPQRRGVLPLDVRRPRHVVESPRPAHGADPAMRCLAHLDHQGTANPPESWCGLTTLTSVMPGRPKSGADGQLTLGQLAREHYGDDRG